MLEKLLKICIQQGKPDSGRVNVQPLEEKRHIKLIPKCLII